ncbi:hypothetical protein C8J57DRAFT_1554519 [Mycena rebaudengoi]|nr:hypothetical protein C8J57DRAFT_1554519 [Mycena rebaudengoi]
MPTVLPFPSLPFPSFSRPSRLPSTHPTPYSLPSPPQTEPTLQPARLAHPVRSPACLPASSSSAPHPAPRSRRMRIKCPVITLAISVPSFRFALALVSSILGLASFPLACFRPTLPRCSQSPMEPISPSQSPSQRLIPRVNSVHACSSIPEPPRQSPSQRCSSPLPPCVLPLLRACEPVPRVSRMVLELIGPACNGSRSAAPGALSSVHPPPISHLAPSSVNYSSNEPTFRAWPAVCGQNM